MSGVREMCDLMFSHFGYEFRCLSEGWETHSGAQAACLFLKSAIKRFCGSETSQLYEALLSSDGAFAGDPVWKSLPIKRLAEIEEQALTVGTQYEPFESGKLNTCTCRLIPNLP